MDLRKLKKLIDLVQESGISELEVTEGEEKVRIAKHSTGPAPVSYAPQAPVMHAAPAAAAPAAPAPALGAPGYRTGRALQPLPCPKIPKPKKNPRMRGTAVSRPSTSQTFNHPPVSRRP